jgi:hypothetical protein
MLSGDYDRAKEETFQLKAKAKNVKVVFVFEYMSPSVFAICFRPSFNGYIVYIDWCIFAVLE